MTEGGTLRAAHGSLGGGPRPQTMGCSRTTVLTKDRERGDLSAAGTGGGTGVGNRTEADGWPQGQRVSGGGGQEAPLAHGYGAGRADH